MSEEKKNDNAEVKKAKPPEKRIKAVIRLGETNIDGNKIVENALLNVKGVSFSLSNAISKISGMGKKKVLDLSEAEIEKIEDMINNPGKYKIPTWMFNRRKDMLTGDDKHLSVSQLDFTKKLDIDSEKKIKSYRGLRHIAGLPVRGQRTRSSFRKGAVQGVSRNKNNPQTKKK